ncbi:MAG: type II secretion system F family protein [Candidatus Hydrogenedentes bacterium]|nr:type II secretion system F family protein [Candidatus Hydrogenedentota bacterium]
MAQFHYRGVDLSGKAVDGTMEGESAHQVTQKLQERGYTISRVEAVRAEQGILSLNRRLSWEDLHTLVTQLESITRTDLPMASALRGLSADLHNTRLKPVLEQLQQDLNRGEELESAIQRQQDRIPPLFAHLVRAGVATGNLNGVLQELCSYTERMVRLKNSFKAASYYPMLVLLFSMAVLGFLMYGVLPMFAEIFQEFGGQLPAPTRFWIGISETIRLHPAAVTVLCAGGIAAVFLGPRALRSTESGRWWLDTLSMSLPVFGVAQRAIILMRFCKTFGLLLHSRIPIVESLELAGAASGSTVLMHVLDEAVQEIASGEPIGASLNRTGFFGHYFSWMVSSSENRGDLPAVLTELGAHYEREVMYRERMMNVLLLPVLVLAAGLIIASVVVSIYLPIFTLGDQINN